MKDRYINDGLHNYLIYSGIGEKGEDTVCKFDAQDQDVIKYRMYLKVLFFPETVGMEQGYYACCLTYKGNEITIFLNKQCEILEIKGLAKAQAIEEGIKLKAISLAKAMVEKLIKDWEDEKRIAEDELNQRVEALGALSANFPFGVDEWRDAAQALLAESEEALLLFPEEGFASGYVSTLNAIRGLQKEGGPLDEDGVVIEENDGHLSEYELVPDVEFSNMAVIWQLATFMKLDEKTELSHELAVQYCKTLGEVQIAFNQNHSQKRLLMVDLDGLYHKLGRMISALLDEYIEKRQFEKLKPFCGKDVLKRLGYKPKTIRYLFSKKGGNDSIELLWKLVNQGLFDPKKCKVTHKGKELSFLAYCYETKNVALMRFALLNQCDFLTIVPSKKLPLLYVLMYEKHPCREVLTKGDACQYDLLFVKLLEVLSKLGIKDNLMVLCARYYMLNDKKPGSKALNKIANILEVNGDIPGCIRDAELATIKKDEIDSLLETYESLGISHKSLWLGLIKKWIGLLRKECEHASHASVADVKIKKLESRATADIAMQIAYMVQRGMYDNDDYVRQSEEQCNIYRGYLQVLKIFYLSLHAMIRKSDQDASAAHIGMFRTETSTALIDIEATLYRINAEEKGIGENHSSEIEGYLQKYGTV